MIPNKDYTMHMSDVGDLRGMMGGVIILVGGSLADLQKVYQEVTVAGHLDNPLAMPYETDLPISVLRGLKVPFDWSRLKHFD